MLFSMRYALLGDAIIAFLTHQQDVREAAVQFLLYAVALPVISVVSYMLDRVFIGAIRTRELRSSMFLSTVAFLATSYGLQQFWGNHGLWIAMIILMLVRTSTLGLHLRRSFTAL